MTEPQKHVWEKKWDTPSSHRAVANNGFQLRFLEERFRIGFRRYRRGIAQHPSNKYF